MKIKEEFAWNANSHTNANKRQFLGRFLNHWLSFHMSSACHCYLYSPISIEIWAHNILYWTCLSTSNHHIMINNISLVLYILIIIWDNQLNEEKKKNKTNTYAELHDQFLFERYPDSSLIRANVFIYKVGTWNVGFNWKITAWKCLITQLNQQKWILFSLLFRSCVESFFFFDFVFDHKHCVCLFLNAI